MMCVIEEDSKARRNTKQAWVCRKKRGIAKESLKKGKGKRKKKKGAKRNSRWEGRRKLCHKMENWFL